MRIGILTLPLHNNYGGILQAYALQTELQRMGNEVEVLQKIQNNIHSPLIMPIVYLKREVVKLIRKIRFYSQKDKNYTINYNNTDNTPESFIYNKIHTRRLHNISEIKESDYDAIIVGSDQIWRGAYYDRQYENIMLSVRPEDAFLSFADGWKIKKIAYAASFGVDSWEYPLSETSKFVRLLGQFDNISVREDSGVQLCRNYLSQEAVHVLDPTLLLDKDDYIRLYKNQKTDKSNRKLFCYILDETKNKTKIIERISEYQGLTPYSINIDRPKATPQPPVEIWLKAFDDAEYVVTDSFHACVFSIIFNKPFIAIGNRERGMSRFNSLLKQFHLEDRLISQNESFEIIDKEIDWDKVNAVLKEWKCKSVKYLEESLI